MLHVLAPAPDLADAVDAAVSMRRSAGPTVTRFPAMPRAMLTLQRPWPGPVAAEGPGLPLPVTFHALATQPSVHHAPMPFSALGLVLHPAAAAQLLGPSTGALVDHQLPWAEVAGAAEARRLDAELLAAGSDAACLTALMASVRRTLARGPERPRAARAEALQRLVALVGRLGVGAAAPLALSERQLERRCRALLALSPKRLQRLVRFRQALALATLLPAPSGADAALAAGYYDQSHLARDSRQLAGAPLQRLLAGAHADGEWWPLATRHPPPAPDVQSRKTAAPLRHHR